VNVTPLYDGLISGKEINTDCPQNSHYFFLTSNDISAALTTVTVAVMKMASPVTLFFRFLVISFIMRLTKHYFFYFNVGRDSAVGIATRYELERLGISSLWGEIIRTRPDRPWGPPSLLYNGYRVSVTGVKRPGRGASHPHSSTEVK
jgi:hypothetical protein